MADNQPTLFDSEIWKPVVGYEGSHEVSDRGKIRSLGRIIPHRNGGTRKYKGKLLKQTKLSNGYMAIRLHVNGVGKTMYAHRIVLEAFVGPCPDGMETCHKDGDPTNNKLDNLRWDTSSENNLDQVRIGTHGMKGRTHCPQGHELIGENLVPAQLKRGYRECRSCNRARGYLWKHPELEGHLQAVSDSYYEAIINPAAQSG